MDFGPLWKKFVGLTAAAAALSAFVPAAPVLAEEPQAPALPSSLVNGDFELPSVSGIVNDEDEYDGKYIEWGWAFGSENFGTYHYNDSSFSLGPREEQDEDEPDYAIDYHWNYPYMVTTTGIFNTVSKNRFGWKTTASNDEAELVNGVIDDDLLGNGSVTEAGMKTYFGENTTSDKSNAGRGDQFAELVANEKSSLYQSISTTPGNTYTWSLMHRGRVDNEEQVNTDSMAVFIGPKQEQELGKYNEDANDIFMQMAELIVPNDGELKDGMMSQFGRTIYSVPVTDGMEITDDSVSLYPTEKHTEKWTCWIITDNSENWETYQATYTVPENQTETTIAFTAVSDAGGSLDPGVSDRGNCIDNVEVGELVPLTIETMAGGSGIVQYDKEAGENGEYKTEYDLTPAAPYYGVFAKGYKVVITAYENDFDEHETFLGALIDGEFKDRNQWASDGNIIGANTYSYKLTMDKRHEVLLLFSETQRISYDPNGGRFSFEEDESDRPGGTWGSIDSDTDLYEISIGTWLGTDKAEWGQDDIPQRDNDKLMYWDLYLVGADPIKPYRGKASPVHTVRQETNSIVFDNEGTGNDISFTDDWFGSDNYYTVLLRAVYTNDITAYANTRSFGENAISLKDTTGGTVSVSSESQYTTGKDGDNSMGIATGETFTVTAKPKPGYTVENWYYIDNDTNEMRLITQGLSDNKTTFTGSFGTDSDKDIYVTFSEVPVSPYLSAVPEDEDGFKDTGITAGIKNIDGYSDDLGGNEYGNTIATGYFVTREFDTNTTTIPSGVWTINIDEDNAFVKLADSSADSSGVSGQAVVTDSKEVSQENKGAIYKASDLGNGFKQQLKLYVGSGTKITGGTVTFGLIIDGLYAPHSQAGFKATTSSEGAAEID